MPTYIVTVTETTRRQVKIAADNTIEAEKLVDANKGEEQSSNRTKNFVTRAQREPTAPVKP